MSTDGCIGASTKVPYNVYACTVSTRTYQPRTEMSPSRLSMCKQFQMQRQCNCSLVINPSWRQQLRGVVMSVATLQSRRC
jgi:hypothetical protein